MAEQFKGFLEVEWVDKNGQKKSKNFENILGYKPEGVNSFGYAKKLTLFFKNNKTKTIHSKKIKITIR